jgi:hypothetical protein
MRQLLAITLLLVPSIGLAQNRSEDEYTRYELLAPETSSFRIIYDVTAVTPGARFYFNPIRKGSTASDESVIDLATGRPLPFEQVSGAEASKAGLTNADLEGEYIKVQLARPVPDGGGARIRIIKTYKDPKSYFRDRDAIVFDRPLGIKRNAVVLPAGYELVGCNIPSQVLEEPDGRIGISFMNPFPGQAPLVVRARPFTEPRAAATPPVPRSTAQAPAPASGSAPAVPMGRIRVSERASQDREIVYFLQDPTTHSFSLYHDYTERREGIDKYLNIVRAGSTVSNPSARNLDTGEALAVDTLKGDAITKAGLLDRELFFGNPEISQATISPDGRYVAFRKPWNGTLNLWVKKTEDTYDQARRITAETARPIPGFFWSRDSRFVLFVQDQGGDENYNVYAVNPADTAAAGQRDAAGAQHHRGQGSPRGHL